MPTFLYTFGHLSPTMRGFTVSTIMLAGALPSVFAGQLADRLGRLRVVIAGAIIFTIGAVFQAAAFHLSMFIIGRALCGIGEGLWISNASV
jgi:MFS family permease